MEDLKNKISLYGWKQLEEKMLLSIVGESGYEAIKCMAYAFYDYRSKWMMFIRKNGYKFLSFMQNTTVLSVLKYKS